MEFNIKNTRSIYLTAEELISKYSKYSLKYALSGKLTDLFTTLNNTEFCEEITGKNALDIIYTEIGDPTNIDDLQYFHDRVYGIILDKNKFGFIVIKASDDEIYEALEDEEHEIEEEIYLYSNSEYFMDLITFILERE